MKDKWHNLRETISERLAMPMVVLAFVFLLVVAFVLCREMGSLARLHEMPFSWGEVIATRCLLILLWLFFLAELIVFYVLRDRNVPFWRYHWRGIFVCLFPPFRLGATSYCRRGELFVPWLGWCRPTRELRKQMATAFNLPMFFIALMILPVLGIEFAHVIKWSMLLKQSVWVAAVVDIATAIIWLAFTVEFIMLCSIAHSRVQYARENWIDLAIIILPWVSFLRSMRVLRFYQMAKLSNLARTAQIYRMRGLAVRLLRALLFMGFMQRLIHRNPHKRLRRLEDKLALKHIELEELREEIEEAKADIVELEARKLKALPEPSPDEPAAAE